MPLRNSITLLVMAITVFIATSAIKVSTSSGLGMSYGDIFAQDVVHGAGDLSPVIRKEVHWLLSSLHESGALTLSPEKQRVIPYFANIAMLALVKRATPVVGAYIDWYLSSINLPDRWGLNGTIYDYWVLGERLIPTGNYDSADSYAATFLTLVRAYYEWTGDREFILSRYDRLDTVARVITSLQDRDGLTRVKPSDNTKYLMDNAESFKGLIDWAFVLESLGKRDEAASYRTCAARLAAGVEYRMWNEKTSSYAWRINRLNIAEAPSWRRWYPDAVSQLYPAMNGLISPKSARASELYARFNKSFPRWPDVNRRHGYPWGMVAWAAFQLGDGQPVVEFLRSTITRYVENGGPHPWYCLESGVFIMVADSLTNAPALTVSTAERIESPPVSSNQAALSQPFRYTRRSEAP